MWLILQIFPRPGRAWASRARVQIWPSLFNFPIFNMFAIFPRLGQAWASRTRAHKALARSGLVLLPWT